MDNESSDDSHDELDVEQEQEDDNVEVDADEDQNTNDLLEDDAPAPEEDTRTSRSSPKVHESWIPAPRKETVSATVFDIVPTM